MAIIAVLFLSALIIVVLILILLKLRNRIKRVKNNQNLYHIRNSLEVYDDMNVHYHHYSTPQYYSGIYTAIEHIEEVQDDSVYVQGDYLQMTSVNNKNNYRV